ncbi:hypothetical protein RB195_003485 [Necator americanus]|uniref:Uncharacterized protein n=1 Tax=Necator americanus TaxID=51031 RepID=A0ABR1DRL0_NECAM
MVKIHEKKEERQCDRSTDTDANRGAMQPMDFHIVFNSLPVSKVETFTVSPKLTATFGPDDRDASAAIRALFQPTDRMAHGQIIHV